jgi:HD superfamily phosphodiesterase
LKLSQLIDFNPRVNVVARICRKLYGDDPAHGWPHILRVMAWAERIVNSEGLDVDPEVLVVSVLLHDIGRLYEGSDHHAIRGSEVASAILLSTPCTGF